MTRRGLAGLLLGTLLGVGGCATTPSPLGPSPSASRAEPSGRSDGSQSPIPSTERTPSPSSTPSATPGPDAGVYLDPGSQVIYAGDTKTFSLGASSSTLLLGIASAVVDFGDGARETVVGSCVGSGHAVSVHHQYLVSGDIVATVTSPRPCNPGWRLSVDGPTHVLVLRGPSAAAAGWPTCATTQIHMSGAGIGAGLGHVAMVFRLENRSSRGCTLDGYPGLRLVSPQGRLLHTEIRRGGGFMFPAIPSHRIALAPGAFAAFDLGYEDVPGGPADQPYDVSCPPATRVRITLPGTAEYGTASVSLAPCEGVVEITPVFAGSDWISFQ
jgi:hypothetical protein